MAVPSQFEKARRFDALHDSGNFVLPNAWDALSGLLCAASGAPAVATSSVAIAFAHGVMDGERIGRDAMLNAAGAIAARLDVPVTADLEGGYGATPGEVSETIQRAIAFGLVGCNLEDSDPATRQLRSPEEAAARIRAAVDAARRADLSDFVVNARCDALFPPRGNPEEALKEAIARGRLYAEMGARCIFVPGPGDASTARALVQGIGGAVNIMVGGFMPTSPVAELADAGVRRISLGGSLMAAAYGNAASVLDEIKTTGAFAYTAAAGPAFMKLMGLVNQPRNER